MHKIRFPGTAYKYVFGKDPQIREQCTLLPQQCALFPESGFYATDPRISTLYPLCGCVAWASGLSFLALAIRNSLKATSDLETEEAEETAVREATQRRKGSAKKIAFVTLMCVFLFLYVGAEIALGAYLTIFCVRSGLGLAFGKGQQKLSSAIYQIFRNPDRAAL